MDEMDLKKAKSIRREVCISVAPTTDREMLYSAAYTLALNKEPAGPILGWLASLENNPEGEKLFIEACQKEGYSEANIIKEKKIEGEKVGFEQPGRQEERLQKRAESIGRQKEALRKEGVNV